MFTIKIKNKYEWNMSKAFDSMHPALLLSELIRAYGFHKNLLNLLRCSVFMRMASRVKMGSHTRVDRGCPRVQA